MNLWRSLCKISTTHPDTIALREYHGEQISYGQLIRKVEQVSAYIEDNKSLDSDFILLDFTKSKEYIFCMLACIRLRLPFIPIDDKTPGQRLQTILKDSNPSLCLTNHRKEFIDYNSIPKAVSLKKKYIKKRDKDLAYLIYTSGSTGFPKGVLVTYSGIQKFILEQIRMFELKAGSIILQNLSIGFDASISEIGCALFSCNTLVIPDKKTDILKIISEEKISHICLSPSYLSLLSPTQIPKTIKTIIIGGEVCSFKTIQLWSKKVRLINVYGPTEATVCTSMIHCDENYLDSSIGNPISGVNYSIHNTNGKRLNPPCTGELWISGNSLALGYLNQKILEETKFIYKDKIRFYKTGDKVFQSEKNDFIFKGRIDRQFKLHGNLIEPYEIENAILKIKDIFLVKVLKKKIEGRFCLIAYFQSSKTIESSSIRNFLKPKLPSWMIPNYFERVQNFKFNLNDKLVSPIEIDSGQAEIVQLWKTVLNLNEIERTKSFEELGGDSLKFIELNFQLSRFGFPHLNSMSERLSDFLNKKSIEQTDIYSISKLNLETRKYKHVNRTPKKIIQSRKIFLTGGTGFLGTEILQTLLKKSDFEIYALYRRTNKSKKINHPRLIWIEGDLSKSKFDIAMKEFKNLESSISKVLHIAADMNLSKNYNELEKVNVESVKTLLDFCQTKNHKEFHYISTLSVILNSNKIGNIISEKKLSAYKSQKEIYGGYAATKWVSERILEQASNYNKQIFIYRCGLLTGNLRDGRFSDKSFFLNFLRTITQTKKAPLLIGNPSINLTPVCFAAEQICKIMNAKKKNHIYHIAKFPNLPYSELLIILRRLKLNISMVSFTEFFEDSPMDMGAITLINHFEMGKNSFPEFDLFLATGQIFVSRNSKHTKIESLENNESIIKLYLKNLL